ncbi:MAG: Cation efflux protein (Precursor) [Burkholderiaceae bacterium]|nr:Cation efflux protein (Precursor) [Burkholderiaceae bacterium]
MNSLKKFMYLSIATAVATITLKMLAYFMTGSVGLFSDALESCVNLAAAVVALIMLTIAEKPADDAHPFGHTKAEYFSSAIEGALILLAAFSIIWTAVPKLFHPQALENLGIGLAVALGASLLNLVTSLILIKKGKENHSIVLEADGRHLMTDVWTSVGVLAGIGLVKLTGWLILDPIIAIAVGLNIVWTGYHLMMRSAHGLLDSGISAEENAKVMAVLDSYKAKQGIDYHALMSRQAGQHKFIKMHVLVPEDWSIKQAHDLANNVESDIRNVFQTPTSVFTHIEPLGDVDEVDEMGATIVPV